MMQKRDIVLTAVFSSIAALIILAGAAAACYYFQKRRRKRQDEEDEAEEGRVAAEEKKSKLNGFLSLKTPLISTKTLGIVENYKRSSMRQTWRQDDMQQAIQVVERQKMGWLKAAKRFNVPKTTLRRRVHEKKNAFVRDAPKGLGRFKTNLPKEEAEDMEAAAGQEEISLNRKLIEATEAVRKKHRNLKNPRLSENKHDTEQFHEPVTAELATLSEAIRKNPIASLSPPSFNTPANYQIRTHIEGKQNVPDEATQLSQNAVLPPTPESEAAASAEYGTLLNNQATRPSHLTFSSECKKLHSFSVEYLRGLKQKPAGYDTSFGVYVDRNNKYKIGDVSILFPSGEITLWRGSENIGKYEASHQLFDLIFLKKPRALADVDGISDETKQKYHDILHKSNCLHENFNPNLPFKRNYTRKFKEIIQPLVNKVGPGGNIHHSRFPIEETFKYRRNIEYVYRDKVKELVDRLRHLWNSRLAGHTGLNNEILFIIQELRAEKIIY